MDRLHKLKAVTHDVECECKHESCGVDPTTMIYISAWGKGSREDLLEELAAVEVKPPDDLRENFTSYVLVVETSSVDEGPRFGCLTIQDWPMRQSESVFIPYRIDTDALVHVKRI